MPIRAQLFDGTTLEFPDGTDQSVISRVAREQTLLRQASAPATSAIAPPPPEGGFFPSVKRGFLQTGMLLGDVLPAMVGKAIGAEEYAKKQWEEAAETQKRIEKEVPAAVPSYKDISGFGDAWVYAKEAVGETIASIIPSLLTGGVAGVLARPAIAAANTAAREAAEKTLMSAAMKMGPPTEVALESAKKAAVQAGIDAAKRTAFRYEVAGGLAGSASQNIPEVYQNIKEETGKEDIPAALIAGGFNAALDTILPAQVLKKIRGQGLSETEVMAAWYKRGAKGLGKGLLIEGATEAAQEASSILAENFVAENSDVFNGKNLERVINAGIKGGLGGGVITAATDIATGKAPPKEQTDRQQIEQLQREITGDIETARAEQALEEAENAKKAAEQAEAARKEAERAPTLPEIVSMAQGKQGYAALETEKQRLIGLKEKTKDVKDAIEAIKDIQNRLVVEEYQRRAPSVPAVMDDKTIRSLGFVKSDNPKSVYQQLLGKSAADPDVSNFLRKYAETARPQTQDRINAFLGRLERAQIPLTAEEAARGEERAGETVTEPSGAGAPVVGEPGAGAPAAGVGITQPSGVVPSVAPVGEPPAGEGVQPAAVAAPSAPPVEPPAAEPLVSLPPRLQNITPAERNLYNFNQSLAEAQLPITGFDFERISDAPSPDGRGMTPERLVLSLEGALSAVKDLDGKLRSKNRTGATVSQLIDQWKTASQIQARINQSKQDTPELWNNYAARQKELGGLKVGDRIQIETGEIGRLDAKFPKNWRIVFDEPQPGILAGTKVLRPKEALRSAAAPAPAPKPTAALAAAPTAPTIITAEQLINLGVKKTQPMIRRIAGKNMDAPADRALVLAELNKYINDKKNPVETRNNLSSFRDQFEEVGREVTVAPTKKRKAQQVVMESALLGRINLVGGLDISLLSEFSEKKEIGVLGKNGRPLVRWINPLTDKGTLFRSGGLQDYVEIARVLEEAGYLEPGAVESDYKEAGERAKNMILAALKKQDAGKTLGEIEEAERKQKEEFERLDQEAIDAELQAEIDAERQAIMEEANLTPSDLDVLDANIPFFSEAPEKTPERLADDMRAMGFTEQEIEDAVAEFSRKAVVAQAPEARAEEIAQAPAAPEVAEELELKAPTKEELAAREAREGEAKAAEREEQKRLEQKAKADAERAEFVLTGSDRAADMAAAAGQMDLLSSPIPTQGALDEDIVASASNKLSEQDKQTLEGHYGTPVSSKETQSRLLEDILKYVNSGAESVAAAIRNIIGKLVKAALSVAVIFNTSGLNPQINTEAYARSVLSMPAKITVTEEQQRAAREADTGGRILSPNAQRVANWIADNADTNEVSQIVDPATGLMYVMKGDKIVADSPALFGKQGIGEINDRLMNITVYEMTEADKITPAGRFPITLDPDSHYGTTLTFLPTKTGGGWAIHRVYLGNAQERRTERLRSSTPDDNMVSQGCVNVSADFYDNVLSKFDYTGKAFAYLLPSDPAKLEKFFNFAKQEKGAPTVPRYSITETAKPAPVKLSKETQAKIEKLGGLLEKMLGKMGLKNVAVNIVQDLERNGEYANRLIKLALDSERPVRDLRHESLHAMKELGFFSDAQWKTLTKMARDKWIDKYLKSRQSIYDGETMSRYDAYMRLYNGNEDLIIEEAIADAFGDFDATKPPPGLMQAILFRMREFFRNIKEAMGMANLDSAEDIFRHVEKGELKETAPAVEAPARASLRAPKTEAFKRWFGDSKIVDESGRPVPVYHATRAPKTGGLFSQFRLSDDGKLGEGIYASSIPEYAEGYSIRGPLMPLWASIENPFVINIDSKFIEYETAPFGETEIPGGRKYPYISSEKPIKEQIEQFVREQTRGKQRAADLMGDSLRDLFEKAGYDGVVVKDENGNFLEVNAFRPEQIKSATGNIGTYDITKPDIRYSLRDAIGLYSELENKIAQGPNAAPAPQWKAYIKGLVQKGVKPEEIEWSGVNDWLDLQTGRVSKEALNDYLKQGGVRVEETVLGGPRRVGDLRVTYSESSDTWQVVDEENNVLEGNIPNRDAAEAVLDGLNQAETIGTKYGQYTLPGGENYREVLLRLPSGVDEKTQRLLDEERYLVLSAEDQAKVNAAKKKAGVAYRSFHWDQPNVIAHIRLNDRTDADGKRVLFVEEIQSDWGQEGKKKGFKRQAGFEVRSVESNEILDTFPSREAAQARVNDAEYPSEWKIVEGVSEGVPGGPFVTKTEGWLNLALKRIMVMAAEGGYDKVAFVNGQQSADRYDLSKQVDGIGYTKNDDGTIDITVYRNRSTVLDKTMQTPAQVEELIGKELTRKIVDSPNRIDAIEGLDLKVGGEGMKTFYDTIVPTAVKKLLPKVGGEQMGAVKINDPTSGENRNLQIKAHPDGDYVVVDKNTNEYFDPDIEQFVQQMPLPMRKPFVNQMLDGLKKTAPILQQPGFDVTPDMKQKVQTTGLPRFSLREVPRANLRDQVDIKILQRVDQTTVPREEKSFAKRINEAIAPKNFSRFRQLALNRYEGLSRIDRMKIEQMGGVDLLADASAESAALMSDMGAGITASALGVHDRKGGAPVYKRYFVVEVNGRTLSKKYQDKAAAEAAASNVNGVVRERGFTTVSNFDDSVKGPVAIFAPLMAKYKDPEIFRLFQLYSGIKRGARFMYTLDANGNAIEKLFTQDDLTNVFPRLEAQFPEFKEVHADWIKYNDKLVDFMRDTGIISAQNAETFKMHGDYFPFYRQLEMDEDAVGPRIFQSIAAVKAPKKLKGSEIALGDFLENIVRNTQSAVQAGIKNVASRRAAQMGMDVGVVQELPIGVTPDPVNSFYVLENGLKKFYETGDHLFIESIKSLNLPDMPFIGMLAGPANLLRNLVTKDPGFILANLMRDSMSAWTTSGVKMTPLVDTARNFAKALASSSPEYEALLNAGVIGGYEFSQNVQTSAKEFGASIRKAAGVPTVTEQIAKPVTSLWQALEKATTASDAATRMEIYKKTLAETGNEAEALYRALEVMNFNRKGSSAIVRLLTAAVPFLNARMQGLDILYRAAIAPSVRGTASERERQIQKTFFVRGAMIMALSAMYWALTHDDEEYKKQEQETRDNYWLLPSLGIKIPIPFEVGVLFKVIPERILAYTMGSDTGKDFLDSMKRQLLNTLAFNPIPQTFIPIVETVTNFSFFTWRPIIPQGMENVAPEYQVGPGTSKLAEGIGKTLKLSPMKIDQLINGYTGTMGMYAVDLMDSIYNTMADSPKPSKRFEQMPVIKRFALDPEARGTVTAYYDLKNAVDQVVRTENLLERTMDYENWGPYMQENMKLLAAKDYVNDMEKTLKDLREMKIMIRSATMSADEKRDSLKQLGQMENALTSNIQELKKTFRP